MYVEFFKKTFYLLGLSCEENKSGTWLKEKKISGTKAPLSCTWYLILRIVRERLFFLINLTAPQQRGQLALARLRHWNGVWENLGVFLQPIAGKLSKNLSGATKNAEWLQLVLHRRGKCFLWPVCSKQEAETSNTLSGQTASDVTKIF